MGEIRREMGRDKEREENGMKAARAGDGERVKDGRNKETEERENG